MATSTINRLLLIVLVMAACRVSRSDKFIYRPNCPKPEYGPKAKTILLPDLSDCSKFFYCVHGSPVRFDCPPTLHFNVRLSVCDWPSSANCHVDIPSSTQANRNSGANMEAPSVPNVTANLTSSGDQTLPKGSSKTKCPKPEYGPEAKLVLLPDLTNCSSFFYCVHGMPVRSICPEGLQFNAQLGVCDYPKYAMCLIENSVENQETLPNEISKTGDTFFIKDGSTSKSNTLATTTSKWPRVIPVNTSTENTIQFAMSTEESGAFSSRTTFDIGTSTNFNKSDEIHFMTPGAKTSSLYTTQSTSESLVPTQPIYSMNSTSKAIGVKLDTPITATTSTELLGKTDRGSSITFSTVTEPFQVTSQNLSDTFTQFQSSSGHSEPSGADVATSPSQFQNSTIKSILETSKSPTESNVPFQDASTIIQITSSPTPHVDMELSHVHTGMTTDNSAILRTTATIDLMAQSTSPFEETSTIILDANAQTQSVTTIELGNMKSDTTFESDQTTLHSITSFHETNTNKLGSNKQVTQFTEKYTLKTESGSTRSEIQESSSVTSQSFQETGTYEIHMSTENTPTLSESSKITTDNAGKGGINQSTMSSDKGSTPPFYNSTEMEHTSTLATRLDISTESSNSEGGSTLGASAEISTYSSPHHETSTNLLDIITGANITKSIDMHRTQTESSFLTSNTISESSDNATVPSTPFQQTSTMQSQMSTTTESSTQSGSSSESIDSSIQTKEMGEITTENSETTSSSSLLSSNTWEEARNTNILDVNTQTEYSSTVLSKHDITIDFNNMTRSSTAESSTETSSPISASLGSSMQSTTYFTIPYNFTAESNIATHRSTWFETSEETTQSNNHLQDTITKLLEMITQPQPTTTENTHLEISTATASTISSSNENVEITSQSSRLFPEISTNRSQISNNVTTESNVITSNSTWFDTSDETIQSNNHHQDTSTKFLEMITQPQPIVTEATHLDIPTTIKSSKEDTELISHSTRSFQESSTHLTDTSTQEIYSTRHIDNSTEFSELDITTITSTWSKSNEETDQSINLTTELGTKQIYTSTKYTSSESTDSNIPISESNETEHATVTESASSTPSEVINTNISDISTQSQYKSTTFEQYITTGYNMVWASTAESNTEASTPIGSSFGSITNFSQFTIENTTDFTNLYNSTTESNVEPFSTFFPTSEEANQSTSSIQDTTYSTILLDMITKEQTTFPEMISSASYSSINSSDFEVTSQSTRSFQETNTSMVNETFETTEESSQTNDLFLETSTTLLNSIIQAQNASTNQASDIDVTTTPNNTILNKAFETSEEISSPSTILQSTRPYQETSTSILHKTEPTEKTSLTNGSLLETSTTLLNSNRQAQNASTEQSSDIDVTSTSKNSILNKTFEYVEESSPTSTMAQSTRPFQETRPFEATEETSQANGSFLETSTTQAQNTSTEQSSDIDVTTTSNNMVLNKTFEYSEESSSTSAMPQSTRPFQEQPQNASTEQSSDIDVTTTFNNTVLNKTFEYIEESSSTSAMPQSTRPFQETRPFEATEETSQTNISILETSTTQLNSITQVQNASTEQSSDIYMSTSNNSVLNKTLEPIEETSLSSTVENKISTQIQDMDTEFTVLNMTRALPYNSTISSKPQFSSETSTSSMFYEETSTSITDTNTTSTQEFVTEFIDTD